MSKHQRELVREEELVHKENETYREDQVRRDTEQKCPVRPEPQQKPLPYLHDWDFWRFLLAALSLLWEIVKTFLR